MIEKVVLVIVILVTIAAHVLLYKWVKFKMDEGLVLQFFQSSAGGSKGKYYRAEDISAETTLSVDRVSSVCSRSKRVNGNADEIRLWCLSE